MSIIKTISKWYRNIRCKLGLHNCVDLPTHETNETAIEKVARSYGLTIYDISASSDMFSFFVRDMIVERGHRMHKQSYCSECDEIIDEMVNFEEELKANLCAIMDRRLKISKLSGNGDCTLHKKSNNDYLIISKNTINATNGCEQDERMVLYYRNGKFFVRDRIEFGEKFETPRSFVDRY